jgi:oxygen-independent coproporphyrinogen-3 oxidase
MLDPSIVQKWDRPVPRYTSYPTAPQFGEMKKETIAEVLAAFDRSEKPLSLYVHIPFCKTMCLFCACSVVLNRRPERQAAYFESLLKEIEMVSAHFTRKRKVAQIHFGGGTPTSLTEAELTALMQKLRSCFEIDGEIAMEVDPRTVWADQGRKLTLLKELGFTRISFGVQDLDPKVQEAVKRRQSEEMTVDTYLKARALGFEGINIDLIYGLPLQTRKGFRQTIGKLIALKPDRIALYSYAKVPWLKKHQTAIVEADLPSPEEKIGIYVDARESLLQNGYEAIGMDHFALASDSMAKGYRDKTLIRNFQGYSLRYAEDMLGLGVTSIGFIEGCYLQNAKELEEYQGKVAEGKLPICRGYQLSQEDRLRREAIQAVMCQFEVDKERFGSLADLSRWIEEGFVREEAKKYVVTELGRLFVRWIASSFDVYLQKGQFSKGV